METGTGVPNPAVQQPARALLERETELRRLRQAVHEAREGAGRLTVIEGPAGIGKTALVRALRTRLDGEVAFFVAGCEDLSVPVPLGPVRELLAAAAPDLFTAEDLDRFTLARLVLAPFIAFDILHDHYGRAIIVLFAAGFTDVIDGYLARRTKTSTAVGAYFDPIADKILLSVIYISLGLAGALPWWMVAVVFGRDVLILAMAAYGLLFTSLRKFPPSVWGKISTFLQIAAALVVMGARDGIPTPVNLALWLMLAGTAWSGVHYIWQGIPLLRSAPV